jgi:hypothetical protein
MASIWRWPASVRPWHRPATSCRSNGRGRTTAAVRQNGGCDQGKAAVEGGRDRAALYLRFGTAAYITY